ncbi:MAG: low temperature requirement protein A [Alphaproteobacteria bacterium]|nr:low temperature requirement protein A [Alphaproteobacteria bacterium]
MAKRTVFALAARDKHEAHRVATPLELMFDLASVIAIATAAHGLAHAVVEGHAVEGLIGFACGFFMIWWAWMNYTWFASAYDDDSPAFRALSMVVMFGALVMAAGVDAAFAGERIWLALSGFLIMRLAMAVFWLAAARGDPDRRTTALRYAAGIVVVQAYWVALVAWVPPDSAAYLPLFAAGALAEVAVPALAEWFGVTTWHRHHIVERYGLLNIIVLGECFLAIVAMIGMSPAAGLPSADHLALAAVSAIIAFSLWSLYFGDESHLAREELRHALVWGYGHFGLFAAGAATGAGMVVMLAVANHEGHVSERTGIWSVAIPVAIYLASLWLVRDRLAPAPFARWLLPAVAAVILLLAALAPFALPLIAAVLVATALGQRLCYRRPQAEAEGAR